MRIRLVPVAGSAGLAHRTRTDRITRQPIPENHIPSAAIGVNTGQPTPNMKTLTLLIIAVIAIPLSGCGPDKNQLRQRLGRVEMEMQQLQSLAYAQKSRMNQADFDAFIGGFAIGYGATSGDGQLAYEGGQTIGQAWGDSQNAQMSLDQIRSRYNQLAAKGRASSGSFDRRMNIDMLLRCLPAG